MQSVFHTGLLFLHFNFSCGTDLDQCNATGELSHAFLKFFTIVIARGAFDLRADVLDAVFNGRGITGTVNDGRIFFRDFDFLGTAELGKRSFIERKADVARNNRTARKDCDVFEHGAAAIAEARSFDGHNLQDAADGVDDQCGEGLAVDVFSDDDERTSSFSDLFKHRQKFANVADLLVVEQDERVLKNCSLLFRLVNEVGREIAAVELHAFDDFEFVLEALAVFNRNHAFLADLIHGFGNDLTDFFIGVGRNGANLSDFLVGRSGLGELLELSDGGGNSLVDAALKVHRVHAGGNELHAFINDGLSENRSSGRTVTGVVARLRGDFAHHGGTHVFKFIFEFDFFGDRHAILRDRRAAERAFKHNVAPLRAERYLDSIGENVDTANHFRAGIITEKNLLSSHFVIP